MSERYWITGVQLGILISTEKQQSRQQIADAIIDKQFIGNYQTDEEKKVFEDKINRFTEEIFSEEEFEDE